MQRTLIEGLQAKDVQAVLNTKNLNNYYYPTLFPLKFTPNFTWKTLSGNKGTQPMADVVSYDSRAPRKTRNVTTAAQGDIPKISIGRDKIESELNTYYQLRQYAGTDEGANAILDWIYEDVDFCYDGVNLRLEWLAMRAASTGKINLTKLNNAGGVVTEASVDFLVPDANKSGVDVPITIANAATSKPITKIKAITKASKTTALVQFILTDQDTVDAILASAETVKFLQPLIAQALNLTVGVDLDSLNSQLAKSSLPQIKVINSVLVTEIESKRNTVYPWEAGVMTFTTSLILGNTYYTVLADEQVTEADVSLKAKRGHILIKKFSNPEPLMESTIGMANAFPALADPTSLYMVDTLNTSWTH